MGQLIETKKKCCKSSPRCKRCPVVYKRLASAGRVERLDKRTYMVVGKLSKQAIKAARSR